MQNTAHSLNSAGFERIDLPDVFSGQTGIVPIPVILDFAVGEEVGLFWIDRTPFVHELAKTRPFNLLTRRGLYDTHQGPLFWQLYYIPDARPGYPPIAAMEHHTNPLDESHMEPWRRLSNQTHWHLTLVGIDDQVADYFEFENVFGLAGVLDAVQQACNGMHAGNFWEAKKEFTDTFSLEDLFELD
jgi:hypothetical protein